MAENTADTAISRLSLTQFLDICRVYHIPDDKHPEVTGPEHKVANPPEGKMAVYVSHLRAGLRFPVNDFITALLNDFGVHLSQVGPNAFRKIISFGLICKSLDIPPSVNVFRHFHISYLPPPGHWITLNKRPGTPELCLNLPSSLGPWKKEYFFIDKSAYPEGMEVADLSSRELDKPLNLSLVERGYVEEISRSPLWWKEPTEDVLGLGGFSPFWASLDPRPSLLVDDVERGLRD